MRKLTLIAALLGLAGVCRAETPDIDPKPPVVPQIAGEDGVKTYLLAVVSSVRVAADDLKRHGGEYAALCKTYGTPVEAAKAKPAEMASLIRKMRNDYKRIDSFGYEYMEGIVAGVPQLMHFDVELDSGVPADGASATDQVADLKIAAGDVTIDHEGSLNNFLIERTVFGTKQKFVAGSATLPGFDGPVNLPKPAVICALADYAVDAYARLDAGARQWEPSDKNLFQAMANMTPTLADYFDEWKESKKTGQSAGGRFVAVARVSDMRGIMASTRLNWVSVEPKVKAKDPALAAEISKGYSQVMEFIDTVDAKDQRRPLTVQAIDAYGSRAKERADKVTNQVKQAAHDMGLDVSEK